MSSPPRVLWAEGLFLCPQHFQQQDLHHAAQLTRLARAVHLHPWGLSEVGLDEGGLEAGYLQLEHLRLTFQDGTRIEAPAVDPLPPARHLNDLHSHGLPVVLHAGLPSLSPTGGNLQEASSPATGPAPRYVTGRLEAQDLFTGAAPTEVATLLPALRILVDGEARDGLLSVPILRLLPSAGNRWRRDPDFIPPALELQASPAPERLLRRLLELCQWKAQRLSATHRERSSSILAFGIADVSSFWLLHTVNRAIPLLAHQLAHPQHHPESLYLLLVQMAAELLTFSSDREAASLPPYTHQDLTGLFTTLEALLRDLLDTVVSRKCRTIPFQQVRPSFLAAHLPEDLARTADLYLSISGEALTATVTESLPHKLKLGCPDDVERLLQAALPGIRLLPVPIPPAPLPVRIGNHYFALERHTPLYEHMAASGTLALHQPQSLPDLRFELFAIQS